MRKRNPQSLKYNLKLTPETNEVLERLMRETNATSYAELIRNSLAMLAALTELGKGGEVIIKHPDGKLEKLTPLLGTHKLREKSGT